MNKIIITAVLMLYSINVHADKESKKEIAKVTPIYENVSKSDLQSNSLKNENDLLLKLIQINESISSSISNALSLIAILLTIIAILIPIFNYFLVIRPNRRELKKLNTIENTILNNVENNFEKYIIEFGRNQFNKMLDMLLKNDNIQFALNYLMLSGYNKFTDNDYIKIINCLKTNQEIDPDNRYALSTKLFDPESLVCEKYFKEIFESDIEKDFDYATEYFVISDIRNHLKFLEKIILGSCFGFNILCNFAYIIERKFLGSLFEKKSPENQKSGEELINLLYNNEKIVKAFSIDKLSFKNQDIIFDNNMLQAFPFYKETLLFKKYKDERTKK